MVHLESFSAQMLFFASITGQQIILLTLDSASSTSTCSPAVNSVSMSHRRSPRSHHTFPHPARSATLRVPPPTNKVLASRGARASRTAVCLRQLATLGEELSAGNHCARKKYVRRPSHAVACARHSIADN
ncbi:hypothetical protein C8R47DRAFT_162037 [Mycena vitilis]|nr:hypothetical protein C8R47DRAFT_162037 [Mycena vitilis]